MANQNLDQSIHFAHNFVSVDSSTLPALNRSAEITLKTVTYPNTLSFNILKNNQLCAPSECTKLASNPVRFSVTGFSNYTTEPTGSVPEFNTSIIILALIVFATLFIFSKDR